MRLKRGVLISIIILAVITGVSFLVWMIPQETKMSVVVSDYENYLDGVKEIRSVLDETISSEFQSLIENNISPEEYMKTADGVSSQITSQIAEFVTSKPPNEWQDSYIKYMESLKTFNSYVTETKVYANLIKEGKNDQLDDTLKRIQDFKSESEKLALESDESRPE